MPRLRECFSKVVFHFCFIERYCDKTKCVSYRGSSSKAGLYQEVHWAYSDGPPPDPKPPFFFFFLPALVGSACEFKSQL